MKQARPESPVASARPVSGMEWMGIALLAGLAAWFLAVSWRKWPDPLIDFGRELYVPWRLANGAVLYRDVDDFYGPLSQYFNAGLFRVFGPGMMVLVTANLVVFAAIVALIYRLFRQAWGVGAAWVAAALFISVFGFSQLVGIGNYNYATPYAHEVTHGLLVCLLLAAVLPAWVEEATPRRSFIAGGMLGLSLVLKPEIILAAGLASLAALAVQRWQRRPLRPAAVGAWMAGAVLPTAGFALYFATKVPWSAAWRMACRAWLNVASSTRFSGDPVQIGFLGFDQPGRHLLEHAVATLVGLVLVAAMVAGARLVDRSKSDGTRWPLLVGLAGVMFAIPCVAPSWGVAGRGLLGLALIYGVASVVALVRPPPAVTVRGSILRFLIAVLAVAFLARMVLNGRIYQFGFYQAALALLLVPAVLIGEVPARLSLGRWGRLAMTVATLALMLSGAGSLAAYSRGLLGAKTHAIGEGRDRFFSFEPQVDPTGDLVGQASNWLRAASRGRPQTLLVLPEGEMINYLSGLPSPVAPFFFYSAATSGGREAEIVRQLGQNPPDWIVLVSRDLREYGVQRYGESPEQGGQILDWMGDRYVVAATFGGDPLDYRQRGLVILQRAR